MSPKEKKGQCRRANFIDTRKKLICKYNCFLMTGKCLQSKKIFPNICCTEIPYFCPIIILRVIVIRLYVWGFVLKIGFRFWSMSFQTRNSPAWVPSELTRNLSNHFTFIYLQLKVHLRIFLWNKSEKLALLTSKNDSQY